MPDEKKEVKEDTLNFIFEYTKDAPETQLKDVEGLDNKVIQILSVSSVIIGLVGFAIGKNGIGFPALWPLILALLAYMGMAVLSFAHLKPADFRRSFQADKLWAYFWNADIQDIKHSLVSDISEAYAFNKEQINKKAHTLRYVIICAAVEVVAVGLFIILSAHYPSLP